MIVPNVLALVDELILAVGTLPAMVSMFVSFVAMMPPYDMLLSFFTSVAGDEQLDVGGNVMNFNVL